MRREGCDENNAQMTDFLCDFCGGTWTEDLPMVEGHKGSLVCGRCLKVAYVEVLTGKHGVEGAECRLCLEERKGLLWQSPVDESACVCERCIRQASTALTQDETSGWSRPA